MKTISTNYKLTTNGKKIRVSLVALFRAVGIGGEVSEADVPGNVLDSLRVQLVRPGVTGAEDLTADTSKPCHYYLDGSMLDVSLAGLTGGVHRLTVLAKYGTNCHALLIADLDAPANVLYLDAGDVVMPLARMAEKDTEVNGVKYYAFAYEYGNKLAWLLDEQPQHLRGTVEAYYVGNIAATFEDATMLDGARLVMNKPGELVYDNGEIIALSPVDTFGSVGGGYKTNKYMDGKGRVIMERMEEGSTVLYDEHENPIAKREANGKTKFFDAYKDERFTIDENGNIHFAELATIENQVVSNTQAIQGIAATGGASVASSVLFNDGENAEVKVGGLSKKINSTGYDLIAIETTKDTYAFHPFDNVIPKGTTIINAKILNKSSYAVSNAYLIKADRQDGPNISTLKFPYTTTEDYIGYSSNVNGYMRILFDGKIGADTARKTINILRTDSMNQVVAKLFIALFNKNTDVYFEKSDYKIDDNVIEYIMAYWSTKPATIGFPLGGGCRYYLNGSTIEVEQTERYRQGIEVSCFDSQTFTYTVGWEIFDGTLINKHSKYCVHDESNGSVTPYCNRLHNVKFVAANGAQCAYGCGIGYNTEIVFDNCQFISDGTQVTGSNFVFHAPNNPTDAIKFALRFINCYMDSNTTISVNPSGFDTSRDSLSLQVSCCKLSNQIPSYVSELFTDKLIFGNV